MRSTARPAPLPGILILTTTPPVYTPTFLVASHIRHSLKEQYHVLLTEQWARYLADTGKEACANQVEPVIWLRNVPAFPNVTLAGDEDEDSAGEEGESEDGTDVEDDDGNVWRGSSKSTQSIFRTEVAERVEEGTAIVNLTIGQVTYLAPLPPGADPVLPLAFLNHLHSVLLMYFPASSSSSSAAKMGSQVPTSIPAATLTSNFDLLYQILQEMLDDGRPLTTDYNSIKGIVRERAWWEDIIGRMSTLSGSQAPPPPQISPLPWRPAQTRYARNEVYIDIQEHLTGVMDRKSKAVGGLDLNVTIACRPKLSGNPELTLALHPDPKQSPSRIISPAFHSSVRHKRWLRDGLLNFVPPDSDFDVVNFAVDAPAATTKTPSLAIAEGSSAWEKDLPFTMKAKRQVVKESKGREWTFEVRLTAKTSRSGPSVAEPLEASFQVGPGLSMLSQQTLLDQPGSVTVDARSAVSSRSSFVASSGSTSVSGDDAGTWRFDPRDGFVTWSIPRLGSGGVSAPGPAEVTLKGFVTLSSSDSSSSSVSIIAKPSPVLTAFSLPRGMPSLSGIRVASLQVAGVEYKPFKGVRNSTSGRIEWRW